MAIASDQLRSARDLFEAAMAVGAPERESIVLEGTAGNPRLRALVERMIAADAEDHALLDHPLSVALPEPEGGTLRPGDELGRYRILREIGSGGMGSVYLAELARSGAGQFYAIKIVRWLSGDLLQRFEKERVILGGLDHPNIARLLDSGVTGPNCPYFVMEYVEGRPIQAFCRDNGVSPENRLRLFRQVCAAVRYLHQNLVVHRDLKPGNILVNAAGTVKLLDFGIAKLLEPDEYAPAAVTALVVTPDYASPEQIRGAAPSTLADVYSLGILLYELLTGRTPFASANADIHETLRRICEEEPVKPSQLAPKVRGELDNIVLKAIRKDPARRYASVEQLDEDVRRYLTGLPVLAQGDSVVYRIRKFVGRNKTAVTAAAVVAILLAGGIVATTREAEIAREARTRAEAQTRIAEGQAIIAEGKTIEARRERENAQREKANAERRLAELEAMARGAVRAYTTAGAEGTAENARDSLALLQREAGLDPALAGLLDTTSADARSYQLARDSTWEVPAGWHGYETEENEYRIGIDRQLAHQGKRSLFLRSLVPVPVGAVSATQYVHALPWRGKRIRVGAFLRAGKIAGQGFLSLVVTGEDTKTQTSGSAAVSTMSPWQRYEVVLDVPSDAAEIGYGIHLWGAGTVWADDFSFESVGTSVPLTVQRSPVNLSFTKK